MGSARRVGPAANAGGLGPRHLLTLALVCAALLPACSARRGGAVRTAAGNPAGGATCPPIATPPACGNQGGYPFTSLVFQGGGVKGIAYAGALAMLEKQDALAGIRRVAGTSAGAIAATLVAVGYTPQEIRGLLLDLDFRQFEDGSELGGPLRMVRRYGWYRGDFFLDWLRQRVQAKTGDPDTTFAGLHAQPERFHDLYVVASDLSRRRPQVFSAATSPDLPVALAVRASMSIPLFFAAAPLDGASFGAPAGEDLFIDGGIFANFPLFVFDRPPFVSGEGPNPQTLGLALLDLQRAADAHVEIEDIREFGRELIEAILAVQEDDLRHSPEHLTRTVVIDSLGVRTADFDLSTQTKCALLREGVLASCRYLEEWSR